MWQQISMMISAYENGRMTRRELVTTMGAMVALAAGAKSARGDEPQPTVQAIELNHVALDVTDVSRSRDWYVKHLGLAVAHQDGERNCFLNCGRHFVALFHNEKAGLNHYCYTIQGYDPGAAVKTLADAGLEPRRRENRVYFDDPDGITVQVSAPNA